MGREVWAFAALVLLLVAAAEAHHKSRHAARHGHHARAAHRNSKAAGRATRQRAEGQLPLLTLTQAGVFSFDFGGDASVQDLTESGRYDPKMLLPYDVTADNYQRNRIIVTTPLMRRGIPATMSSILVDEDGSSVPRPYPNFDVHRTTEDTITDCYNQLVDVVTTVKTWEDDDTLYAIDNGVLDLVTSPKNVCPPKIVTIDLLTDEITSTTVIENAACNSLYTSLWVDTCPYGSLTAYISDTRANVLTVTDLKTGVSKHLNSQYFHPKPGFFFTMAGGPSYYMPNGLCGVTAEHSCDGKLYFQAMASNVQGVVDKQVIRDAKDGDVLDIKTQVNLPGELSGSSGEFVVDPTGQLLFFPVLDKVAVYCWNISKPHNPDNFLMIAQDIERLDYVSSLNLDPRQRRLYIVSDRFTYYLSNTTDYSDTNYRFMYIDLQDIEC